MAHVTTSLGTGPDELVILGRLFYFQKKKTEGPFDGSILERGFVTGSLMNDLLACCVAFRMRRAKPEHSQRFCNP